MKWQDMNRADQILSVKALRLSGMSPAEIHRHLRITMGAVSRAMAHIKHEARPMAAADSSIGIKPYGGGKSEIDPDAVLALPRARTGPSACRWPVGSGFCLGHVDKAPYCDEHRRIAYTERVQDVD